MTRLFVDIAVLTWMELLRYMRTPGVARYMLVLPWMAVPAGLLLSAGLMSTGMLRPSVAVPPDLPEELALGSAFAAQQIDVVVSDDPGALVVSRAVDGAVLSVRQGDGLYAVTGPERGERFVYEIEMTADHPELRSVMGRAVRTAGNQVLENMVWASGGDAGEDLWVAGIGLELDPAVVGQKDPFGPAFAGYSVWLMALFGYLLITSGPVADRDLGVTEGLFTTQMSATAYVASRIASVSALQVTGAALFYGSVYLLFSSQVNVVPSVGAPFATVASLLMLNAGFVLVGVTAPSVKAASNGAGMVWLTCTIGFTMGYALDVPAWFPLIGLVGVDTPLQYWQAAFSSLTGAVLIAVLTATFLERDASYKIGATR